MTNATMHAQDLPRTPDAASRARRLLATWLGESLERVELDRAKTICSELVNNAFLHGKGRIELRVDLDDNRLLMEVVDEGDGFEHELRVVPFEQLSGRGLLIVEAEASRWGVHRGTTHVWAEIERPGPRVGEQARPQSA